MRLGSPSFQVLGGGSAGLGVFLGEADERVAEVMQQTSGFWRNAVGVVPDRVVFFCERLPAQGTAVSLLSQCGVKHFLVPPDLVIRAGCPTRWGRSSASTVPGAAFLFPAIRKVFLKVSSLPAQPCCSALFRGLRQNLHSLDYPLIIP